MEELTTQQVIESKLLIQRYFALDNEKEAIRLQLEKTIPMELHEQITEYRKAEVIHALDSGEEFLDSVVGDELPYSIESYIDDHDSFLKEDLHIDWCTHCGSKEIRQTEGRTLTREHEHKFGHISAQYKCDACGWEFGENEWHDALDEHEGEDSNDK